MDMPILRRPAHINCWVEVRGPSRRQGAQVRRLCGIPVAEVDRLIEARGIAPEVAQRAALAKAVGFNDWTSPTVAAGERMHGGPACAFIVRMLLNGATITRHKAS